MRVTIKVDKKLCIGSGSCVVVAAEHFDLNDEGKAEIKASKQSKPKGMELSLEVTTAARKRLLDAARVCPAQAITIIEE